MKPTKTLIEAFLSAAEELETTPEHYSWGVAHKCNVGILAKHLLGLPDMEFRKLVPPGNWVNSAARAYCQHTNLPMPTIFRLLATHGLEHGDYAAIEFMSWDPGNCNDPEVVAKAFRSKAAELQEMRRRP